MTGGPHFIALDGPDGGGKGTQLQHLARVFAEAGIDHITTREAGGTKTGQILRKVILDKDLAAEDGEIDALTSVYLFMADRRHNVIQNILPALQSGKWVLADRYGWATTMYQGFGLGGDVEMIHQMLKQATIVAPATEPLMADLYLILDVPAEEGMRRKNTQVGHSIDRLESKGTELQQKVRAGYLEFLKHPDLAERSEMIDAAQDEMAVHRAIVDAVNRRCGLTLRPLDSLEYAR